MRIGVVGGGWAGLAAAVRATQAGHEVTVFESAPMPGGRARSDHDGDDASDNGQHILLGGYARTLALMRDVGVDVEAALLRLPLTLMYPDGCGFSLPRGPRAIAAMRALAGATGFSAVDKASIAALSVAWHLRRFRAPASMTVDALLRNLATPRVRERLLDPLCVAALNTPPAQASAAVFLAVMRDSLFGAPGASDLLLPRRPLARLLPLPAVAWLREHGATVDLRRRIAALERDADGWMLRPDRPELPAARFDRVILASSASEAARLAGPVAPAWAATTSALHHEPIVTVTLRAPPRHWPARMLALRCDATLRPAQFAFRLEVPLSGATAERVTLVASAASEWLARGTEAVAAAAVAQYREAFGIGSEESVDCVDLRADRRATFRCEAGVRRPSGRLAAGLLAAGDYVDGPYPATLEGAVLAGEAAVRLATSDGGA